MSHTRIGVIVFALAILTPLMAAPGSLHAQAEAQQGAPPEAPTRAPRYSWVVDRTPLRVGDVVTIVVDEFTLAESSRDESTSRRRRRDVGTDIGLNGSGFGFDVGSRNDFQNRTQGDAARSDRFAAEISVRVVETGANGLVRVEGVKKLQIDGHIQDVTVRGWLRSNDVRPGNTIQSWRVADAEIIYGSNQTLGEGPQNIWSKLFGWIVP
jgi:flagellar L-ring protein precursor FlgH